MRSSRELRRLNYLAAEAECKRRGIALGYWPGDEEFSGQLSLPLKPGADADGTDSNQPVNSPSERHLRIVSSEGDHP